MNAGVAATLGGKLVFCLSGNPFAAAATLEQLMAVKGMNRPSAEAVHKHFHGGKSGRSDGVAGDNKDKEDQT